MRVTRRQLVTTAGCVIGSILVAEAVLLRKDMFKSTMTTLFWVGEPSDADNAFIPNNASYWDKDWQRHYGHR
jgi:hypothetical protein